LGNHVHPKGNQQLIVARFDKEGNELIHYDLDALFSQSRISIPNTSRASPTNSTSSSSGDSASCSGSSTPQRTSSPFPTLQPSMYHNGPLFTPARTLSPQAPVFQMCLSAPINVPSHPHPLENDFNHTDEGSPIEGNNSQPERSDTPHSMYSTTSNESSDSGYCGYVESYPCKIRIFLFILNNKFFFSFFIDYYKLNRLYKALALQKHSVNAPPMGKNSHPRRLPNHIYQQQNIIPSLSTSPTTPTPMNIDRLAPFYVQPAYLPIPATVTSSRKSKY
jgi:hypothetical protein